VGGRRSKRPGPSPTLGSLGPSHQWRHKSRVSFRGPPCAHGVAGTPHGEVCDRRYECITADEDLLNIAADEVTYKIRPTVSDSSTSCDPANPEVPPSSPGNPPPRRAPSPALSSRRAVSPPLPPPEIHPEAGPSHASPWRNVDLSSWDFPETPFKRVHDKLNELQTQYNRLEHITREASVAPGGYGPGNILREIAKKADRKELDQVKRELEQAQTDSAHLHSQMASMAEELGQKREEVRKYHAKQAMVFTRIRELIGHPGEIANKAPLYDQLVESGDPTSAKQTIPILVKYARRMNDLFAEIQKIVPPGGTPRRVLYQGSPGSPSGTFYEVVGEVAFVQDPPAVAEPSQQGGGSGPGNSGKDPKKTHSSGARRKSTSSARAGSARSGRG
jgi:hypothetical protein